MPHHPQVGRAVSSAFISPSNQKTTGHPPAYRMDPTKNMPTDTTKRRVLVVDDNQDAATTLALILKLTGHEAHTRYDGQTGVEAAGSLRPQVVILDISMPGMDGYQACRFIRKEPWGKAMVLIALSGYGQADDIQRSTEAGFDAHLVKPVDLAALNELLATAPPIIPG